MKKTFAILRKECREQAWFAAAGVLLFCVLPVILAAANYYSAKIHNPGTAKFWSDDEIGIIVGFGGVFAIILAVAVTCRDLSGRLYDFWQSRPISLHRLLAAKYLVGLLIVLLTTWGGLLINLWMLYRSISSIWPLDFLSILSLGVSHSFILMLIFSIAFLLGCVVRQSARAAILAILAGLVIYFVPIIVPSLEKLSFLNIMAGAPWMNDPRIIRGVPMWENLVYLVRHFQAAMPLLAACVCGSIVAVVAACIAVARGWLLRADKKVLSWSLVAVVLILMAAASQQIGSNMNCRASFELAPAGTQGHFDAAAVYTDGRTGMFLTYPNRKNYYPDKPNISVCSFSINDTGLHVGPIGLSELTPSPMLYSGLSAEQHWSPQNPHLLYRLNIKADTQKSQLITAMELMTVSLEPGERPALVHRLDLLPEVSGDSFGGVKLVRYGRNLYLRTSNHLLTLDISNADSPTVTSNAGQLSWKNYSYWKIRPDNTLKEMPLLLIDGLSLQQRLEVTVALSPSMMALDGDLLVWARFDRLETYRVTVGDDAIARMELLGRYAPSPLERLIGFYPQKIVVRNGVMYVLGYGASRGLTVYDIRNPAAIRRLGHYSSGGDRFHDMTLLDDGSILLAGSQVQIIEPKKLKD